MKLSLTSLEFYPCEVEFCFLHLDNGMCIDVLPSYSLDNMWGYPKNIQSCELPNDVEIVSIDVVWLSLCEKKFYSIEKKLKQCFIADNSIKEGFEMVHKLNQLEAEENEIRRQQTNGEQEPDSE